MEKPRLKPVCVRLSGRSTGMGAFTQYHLYSIRQRRRLEPKRREYSRTGNHWDDVYYLLPGKYFLAVKDITNSGKHRCRYAVLRVLTEDEYREKCKRLNYVYALEHFNEYYRQYAYEIEDLSTSEPPAPYVEPPCSCLREAETPDY